MLIIGCLLVIASIVAVAMYVAVAFCPDMVRPNPCYQPRYVRSSLGVLLITRTHIYAWGRYASLYA